MGKAQAVTRIKKYALGLVIICNHLQNSFGTEILQNGSHRLELGPDFRQLSSLILSVKDALVF